MILKVDVLHSVSSGISEFCGSFSNIQLNNQQYASNVYKVNNLISGSERFQSTYADGVHCMYSQKKINACNLMI